MSSKALFWTWWVIISVFTLVIGGLTATSNVQLSSWCVIIGTSMLVFPVVVWVWHVITRSMDQMGQAMQPVMSPQQIQIQLSEDLGRPATLVEVAAVHQMLSSEKNQQMVNSGLTLGALYLIGRNL